MTKYTKANWVHQLPADVQVGIAKALERKGKDVGYKGMELKRLVSDGLNSRLYDLTETINVNYWLDKANRVKKRK